MSPFFYLADCSLLKRCPSTDYWWFVSGCLTSASTTWTKYLFRVSSLSWILKRSVSHSPCPQNFVIWESILHGHVGGIVPKLTSNYVTYKFSNSYYQKNEHGAHSHSTRVPHLSTFFFFFWPQSFSSTPIANSQPCWTSLFHENTVMSSLLPTCPSLGLMQSVGEKLYTFLRLSLVMDSLMKPLVIIWRESNYSPQWTRLNLV